MKKIIDDEPDVSQSPDHLFSYDVKKRSDRLINYFLAGYFLIGLVLAPYYGTWTIAIGVGGLSLIAYYSVRLVLPESSLYQYVLGIVLGIFMAQFIYQMHGLFEMHFFAFIGSAILITYQKWKLQIPLMIVVLVHHTLFGYLQDIGQANVFFTKLDYIDLQTIVIHILLVAVIFFICGLWSYQLLNQRNQQVRQARQMVILQKDALMSEERKHNEEILKATNQQLMALNQELEKARQLAEVSSSAKDIFLSNMSHEIRTPMNAVLGMSKLMAKTSLAPQQLHYLNIISNATSSLMFIINDILDFSKISAGELSLKRVGFNLENVISNSLDMVAFMAKDKGLELHQNTHSFNKVLIGDPFRLSQVFINLLSNSVKFTSHGSISIDCRDNGPLHGKRHLTVQVKDTGKGMDDEFLKILFEKFTQEDDNTARSYGGTGLGMSISKHLVEMMGGTITVESRKNVGTTFILELFFDEGTMTDLLVAKELPINVSALQHKRILLVEDNEINQMVAQTVLEQNGMKVFLAGNGEEAIDSLQDAEFDLILMDMQMPVMDGLHATVIIRETNKKIPIIALTANALQLEREKCISAGMNDFLAKPFEENELLGLLCKWIDTNPADAAPSKTNSGIPVKSVLREPKTVDEPANKPCPLFDLGPLKALSPGNNGFLRSIINVFIKESGNAAKNMREAYKKNDFKMIKKLAHSIKPSVDQFSLPYQVQIRHIEKLCEANAASEELETLISDFETLVAKIKPEMEKEIQ